MMDIFKRTARAVTFALAMASSSAFAGTLLEPGETSGLATGAPLPEGVFFIDTFAFTPASRQVPDGGLGVNIPIIAWATPFVFYNTRLQILAAVPEVFTTRNSGITNRLYAYNPGLVFAFAHDFGNGFGATYYAGVRPGMNETPAYHETSYEQRFALSYVKDGWDFTAILQNGIFDTNYAPDYLQLDVTASKKFGKLELGFVGTASSDVGHLFTGYGTRQQQAAIGGLIGYDFGRFTLQALSFTDVAQRGYFRKESRGFLRLVVPLYVAPTPTAPVVARY